MRKMLIVASLAAALSPLGGATAQETPPQTAQGRTAVAVEQVAIGPERRQMVLVVWKPAAMAAPHGPRKRQATGAERLPLIILSHGTGAGPMAHVDTAEALAAAGFVVAAPLHRGDNFQDQGNVGRPHWIASRSSDVTDLIDYMLTAWSGQRAIDSARIGIFGFSAGGTTALVATGGVPDLERVRAHCRDKREFVCSLMMPKSADTAASPGWTHDGRIRAAVIAAPGLGFAFEPAGLSKVRVPVQLWSGAEDATVPYATNAAVVTRLLPAPPEFHRVDDAVHLSFLAPCGPEAPPQPCENKPGFDRRAFHRELNASVVDFFRRHLRAGVGTP